MVVATCLLGIASVLFHSVGESAVLYSRVVRVSDGDAVSIADAERKRYRVRLAGIDAPNRGQAYGRVSKQHLVSQVFGRSVIVDWYKVDRYG